MHTETPRHGRRPLHTPSLSSRTTIRTTSPSVLSHHTHPPNPSWSTYGRLPYAWYCCYENRRRFHKAFPGAEPGRMAHARRLSEKCSIMRNGSEVRMSSSFRMRSSSPSTSEVRISKLGSSYFWKTRYSALGKQSCAKQRDWLMLRMYHAKGPRRPT